MDSCQLAQYVRADGTLDDGRILSRKSLYAGRNGKVVERFVINTWEGPKSFIFKPPTNSDTAGRERWAAENLLPEIPVRYPAMLAKSEHTDFEHSWVIYEDLGELVHRFDLQILKRAAAIIPYWHRLPVDRLPNEVVGHTPFFDQIVAIIRQNSQRLAGILIALGAEKKAAQLIGESLVFKGERMQTQSVVSHGDFHPYNLAMPCDELIVLDWEYVHCNSVYWDLYNLLDITSPRYRRPELTPAGRVQVLNTYLGSRAAIGLPAIDDFLDEYHLYAAVFSAWILLLIDQDLNAVNWDLASLIDQRRETHHVLCDCLAFLGLPQ